MSELAMMKIVSRERGAVRFAAMTLRFAAAAAATPFEATAVEATDVFHFTPVVWEVLQRFIEGLWGGKEKVLPNNDEDFFFPKCNYLGR